MQHVMNLDTPKTRTTSRGLTLTWTRCRLYVGPERLAGEETPITCRDCLRAVLDSIDVPLVHPVPTPAAADQWAYIERLRQATGKAQQAVLPGIGDVPLDGELFTYRELRDRKTNQVLATQIGYRDTATYFVPTRASTAV